MIYGIPKKISWPFIIFFTLILVVMTLFLVREDDPRIEDAEKSYHIGESTKAIAARKKAFNAALNDYLDLEQRYNPQYGTGKLFYNIGNTYFQLEEYPQAILYFLKAQTLMPRDDAIRHNLEAAQDKLSLKKSPEVNAFYKVFFFHNYLSLPERLQVFFVSSLLAIILASTYLWIKNVWFERALFVVLFIAACTLLSLGYTRYISPIEAVMVKSSDLYLDAGTQYAKVGNKPLPAGTQVEVISPPSNEKWFKVRTPNGDPGYVPQEAIRIIT